MVIGALFGHGLAGSDGPASIIGWMSSTSPCRNIATDRVSRAVPPWGQHPQAIGDRGRPHQPQTASGACHARTWQSIRIRGRTKDGPVALIDSPPNLGTRITSHGRSSDPFRHAKTARQALDLKQRYPGPSIEAWVSSAQINASRHPCGWWQSSRHSRQDGCSAPACGCPAHHRPDPWTWRTPLRPRGWQSAA